MEKYNNLELAVLSCLVQRADLMKDTKLETKHFKKHYKIWNFLKAFYDKFGNFDLTLMMAVSKNKYRMIEYIMWLLDKEPAPSLFKMYEEQLLNAYETNEREAWLREKVYELANSYFVSAVDTKQFKSELEKIFKNSEEIFGGKENGFE